MPERLYALARGESKRLKVKWNRRGQVRVFLDSNELAPTGSHPPSFRLPDASVITAYLDPDGLDILRDSERLPGSRFDPQHQIFISAATLVILAVAHFAIPWIPLRQMLPRDFPSNELSGWAPVAGLLYLAFGFLVYRRSRAALWAAMSVWFVEASGLATLYMLYSHEIRFKLLIVLFGLIGLLFTADDAIVQLRPGSVDTDPHTRV
jgi:hypothetical protein